VQAQPAEITPALFVVRDADSTLYLYGTVHALPHNAPWANAAVRSALSESDEVWTESNMSEDSSRQFAEDLISSMATPAETPLSNRLPAAQRTTLRYASKALDIDLNRLAPWQAALLLMSWGGEHGGRAIGAGVDVQVAAAAREEGKPLRWLEELDVADFAALPDDTQLQFLMFVLDGMRDRQSLSLEELWARGDLAAMEETQLARMAAAYPAFYQWIAVARNNAWMDVLLRELEGAGVDFVAVGAGHLLGADSLVEQMRARGYAVERIGGS